MTFSQIEIGAIDAARFDVGQGADNGAQAGDIGQHGVGAVAWRLRHMGHAPVAHHAAGLRGQRAKHHPQQHRFTRAVAPDDAMARGGEVVADVVKQDAAVGQRHADALQAEEGGREGRGCDGRGRAGRGRDEGRMRRGLRRRRRAGRPGHG
ncbi:hypothetical protein D3C87_1165780 [compost metagenome]